MKVFLVGATGYIGSVVAEKLQAAGHSVLGLVRSDKAATKLQERGIESHYGNLEDIHCLTEGASCADGVICTFHSDSFEVDRNAINAMLTALDGSQKPFIFTSGSGVVGDMAAGEASELVFDEQTPFQPKPSMAVRVGIEQSVLVAATSGIRSVVLRPPLVYGRGSSIQVPLLLEYARKNGVARYIGKGENIWSTVHVEDLADLYVLALERAPAGTLLNTASGEATMKQMAEAISRLLGLGKAESWTMEEASKEWGEFIAQDAMGANSRITGAKAGKLLSWEPKAPSVLEDIEHGSYSNGFEVTGAWVATQRERTPSDP